MCRRNPPFRCPPLLRAPPLWAPYPAHRLAALLSAFFAVVDGVNAFRKGRKQQLAIQPVNLYFNMTHNITHLPEKNKHVLNDLPALKIKKRIQSATHRPFMLYRTYVNRNINDCCKMIYPHRQLIHWRCHVKRSLCN